MAANDLCRLADVKAWLGRADTNSDAVLTALIARASRQILSWLQRSVILPHTVTEIRGGNGGRFLMLRQWPVTSVTSLVVAGQTIPPMRSGGSMPGPGWALEPWDGTPPGRAQEIVLCDYYFGYWGTGKTQNTQVVYQAGYQVSAEPQTIVNGTAIVTAPYGAWASDVGVTYADGTPLVPVTGAPAIGQYQLTPGMPGSYTFNTGDNGAAVLISYGFVPADLADACIELASERFRYAQRIGEKTHSLGGNETVSFDNARFTPLVAALLQPYRNLLPM
ncbi:MAG TPA: hypothetical protein VG274_09590 [Rhizomicrobium sp.]|jgi:hypothetical protein|nr:hypothetical protein [Rhizomicrobium sp.]